MLARQLFPGGVEVRSQGGLDQAIRATRELIANREVPAIFEGAFEHGGVLVRVDILHRRRNGRWRLIEVKSTTDLKDHHLDDVGIQNRVVSGPGLDVASACLAHVNRSYVYPGGDIDPRKFLRIRNLTRRVRLSQPKITFQLRSEFTVLAVPQPQEMAPGRHCTDPVTCEFFERCNPPLPHNHIGFMPRLHASTVEALEEMGVELVRDIPYDFELTDIQRRAATCVQTGEPWFSLELRDVLGGLTYPLYSADFDAEPEHYEFLATDARDPRREFISSLCGTVGESGSIVVYSSFEFQRLSELGSWFPEFADRINAIQERLFDLLPIVRDHTHHAAFARSYSLKSVLPALVRQMELRRHGSRDGQAAGLSWERLIRDHCGEAERKRSRKALPTIVRKTSWG